ncbi:3-deoxy-manno-octulosonate cytidylyltransferase [Cyanobium sp. WAJ14-Wanaka]|uniref:3-deoxy-manno-octulosonate cytidylyltransferase n=1 Tax=Cyanobium sp. WAJ14-Wanaka TaxID=2823725 RepID=UPI0020CEC9BC|nr:3-deoxy-manno-octulosonate cytidylyltransferase [Cyanobium sp. WAJ14-Wanaka]MCP9775767.1 3-deoxy-manno-octulosonate cytidylyltransferase [Cyanobium sp. WAJ14-Wanaka]
MTSPRAVVAVPARLESSRLPGKVMADIGGKPMLRHVLERCALAKGVAAVIACTDSELVQRHAQDWGFDALLTPASCASGSERLASVLAELVAAAGGEPEDTLVINVQGDQPLLDPTIIETMVEQFAARHKPQVLTPVYALGPDKLHDPNVVKVLRAADGRAITFSRSALPHVRDVPPELWHQHCPYWGHVGMYGYRADVLAGWNQLPISQLEGLEKLEQLRLVEAGIPLHTFVVDGDCFSVDTQDQLELARRLA